MTRAAPRGRTRSEPARRAILDAAFALLTQDGFARLSIERVAARAGVGKATIYRWWATRGTLAVEAFLTAVAPAIAFRHTRSARADIVRQMQALARLYRGRTGRFVREMIGASQHDPEMRAAFHAGFLVPRRAAARAVFERAVDRGELRAPDRNLDLELAIDALYGPIYYRLLASDAPIDDGFIRRLAAAVFRGLAP